MSMVQCLVTGWIVSLSQPVHPPSLVSALCNFSERFWSQRYIHVYFNIQVCSTSISIQHIIVLLVVSTHITSDKLLDTRDLYLQQRCCTQWQRPMPNRTECSFLHNVAEKKNNYGMSKWETNRCLLCLGLVFCWSVHPPRTAWTLSLSSTVKYLPRLLPS